MLLYGFLKSRDKRAELTSRQDYGEQRLFADTKHQRMGTCAHESGIPIAEGGGGWARFRCRSGLKLAQQVLCAPQRNHALPR